ncbi:MAG: L,D-transpeptidase family protein [Hyphomicrobiaceae bacterium]|nr:L,D-transpeptidase family protein [Hyphomicrobiaceae bacterium]
MQASKGFAGMGLDLKSISLAMAFAAVLTPALAREAPRLAEVSPVAAGAAAPLPAEAAALRGLLAAWQEGASDEDRNELAAARAYYEGRAWAPVWTSAQGVSAKAAALLDELDRADDWGLSRRDFPTPAAAIVKGGDTSPAALAAAEAEITFTALRYGRFARGGRIINPAEQLSSYLDRRPQLVRPAAIIDGLAAAEDAGAYLRGLHPQHPQFEKLRQRYLAAVAGKGSAHALEARKLLANLEQWRWMPADMGAVYIWNNLPEFLQRVVVDGEVARTERIVAGELSKQTPVFSRPLRRLTFKPTWIVPDSIKVKELWPSLLKDGRLMREWALEITTKDGKPVDWRKLDWAKTDIREYEVIQPNGPKSVMGKFKFSFPNQHTVFMHDTLPRDKYMFNVAQRTYSHGCIRVKNPMQLAELILKADKGWDAEQTRQVFDTTPLNHTIEMERRVMVHTTYFTAMVDEHDKLHTFRDVYGHEKRIALALEGKWKEIRKGRDHLAPVELDLSAAEKIKGEEDRKKGASDFFTSLFGG